MPYWMRSRKRDRSTTDFYRKNENSRDGWTASSARDAWNANHTVIALISVRSVRRFDPSFRGGDVYLLPFVSYFETRWRERGMHDINIFGPQRFILYSIIFA